MILEVSPDAPLLVRGAAALILTLHIGAGSVGILSGAASLIFRKGSRRHRLAGNVFFVSMLVMSAIGACVAPFLSKRLDSLMGAFTFYLVATAWATVRRKPGHVGLFEVIAFNFALGGAAIAIAFASIAQDSPKGMLDGYAAEGYYLVAGLLGLSALLDFKMIMHSGVHGAQRIARHLWRMCLAMLIATASLFLGQPQLFPKAAHDTHVLVVPVLAVLVVTIYWIIRVLFTRLYKRPDVNRQNHSMAASNVPRLLPSNSRR